MEEDCSLVPGHVLSPSIYRSFQRAIRRFGIKEGIECGQIMIKTGDLDPCLVYILAKIQPCSGFYSTWITHTPNVQVWPEELLRFIKSINSKASKSCFTRKVQQKHSHRRNEPSRSEAKGHC